MIARIMILAPVIGCIVGWLILRIPDEDSAGALISLSITGNIWGVYLVFHAIRDNMRRMEGRIKRAYKRTVATTDNCNGMYVESPRAQIPLIRDQKLRKNERVGDDERDLVIRELGLHLQFGRLDMEEFDTRSSAALKSKVFGELNEVLWDLPLIRDDGRKLNM